MSTMDMCFGMSDSMSLQEMLDIDIKSEIDTLIGGHNDISGMNFADLPPLEIDDVHDIRWFSNAHSTLSNSSFTLDIPGDDYTTMVDPNAVMPVIGSIVRSPSPAPALKESHLAFSPPGCKLNGSQELLAALDEQACGAIKLEKATSSSSSSAFEASKPSIIRKAAPIAAPIIKTISKVAPILSKSIVKVGKAPLLSFRNTVGGRQITSPVTVAQLANLGQVRTITAAASAQTHARKQQFTNNRIYSDDMKAFPKPAYSYSCLIAMALKNSRTGSLPVSEIYNFMCRHFPYFKTAPNGWKNSVRHNLSLNKCFQKIEKPALNGTQRKGCLWAMKPSKVGKMDEEVQKWSKKDPSAIRRAMVDPSNLELLERGELKFSCAYDESGYHFGDSCGSAESEGSDSEPETAKMLQPQFIAIGSIKAEVEEVEEEEDEEEEEEEEEELETDEYDLEVTDSLYDDEIDEDQEILRMEMALAQKELLEYDPSAVKRRKTMTYIIQN